MQNFLKEIKEAGKKIQIADHLLYLTFPLLKDKKILIKILLELKSAIAKIINIILQREYLYKKIKLYDNPKTNFKTFAEKSSGRYGIADAEIKMIVELFEFAEQYKKSPMELLKNEKIIIFTDDMRPKTITLEKTKKFSALAKNILKKVQNSI